MHRPVESNIQCVRRYNSGWSLDWEKVNSSSNSGTSCHVHGTHSFDDRIRVDQLPSGNHGSRGRHRFIMEEMWSPPPKPRRPRVDLETLDLVGNATTHNANGTGNKTEFGNYLRFVTLICAALSLCGFAQFRKGGEQTRIRQMEQQQARVRCPAQHTRWLFPVRKSQIQTSQHWGLIPITRSVYTLNDILPLSST